MGKKKNTFGKLLAFTTAAAAIGGTCYIFRDKIKSCPLYQKATDMLSGLCGGITDKFDEDDDFSFDDEDDFEDVFTGAEHNREYTSITINAKDSSDSSKIITDEQSKENANAAKITEYEHEGLSDVSEDPDTLEDQDKLDF